MLEVLYFCHIYKFFSDDTKKYYLAMHAHIKV